VGLDILEIISVALVSSIKLVWGGVPMALSFGFSILETIFVTSSGGIIGVLAFVALSDFLVKRFKKRAKKRKLEKTSQNSVKIFTRKNKLIVRIKTRFGLIGIAFLTPILFSIPLGSFLAIRYFKSKQKVISYMFASVLFWSFSTSLLLNPLINAIRTYFL